jgi:hypothetical protein
MTEQDWADLCERLIDNNKVFRYGAISEPTTTQLKEILWAWADWAEEKGLEYHRGLRLLANYKHGPRFPFCSLWFGTDNWNFPNTIPSELRKRHEYPTKDRTLVHMTINAAFAMQEVFPES